MKEGEFLIEKVIVVVGDKAWGDLPEEVKKRILFDKFCPAGGTREEDYHRDGSRYWEKIGRKDLIWAIQNENQYR